MDGVSHSEGTLHSAWCQKMSLPVAHTTGYISSVRHPDSPRSSSLTCKHVCSRASPGVSPSPSPARALAPATAAGTGPQPWEPFPFATHKSAGHGLWHPSSSRSNRRNCCFLVPCEQQEGGTQDILPNISGLILKKKNHSTECHSDLHRVLQRISWYGCSAQTMCMFEPFSHMLEINSCTSCKSNLSTKVPNGPGKHLCHSFPSGVHPSSQLYSKVFSLR